MAITRLLLLLVATIAQQYVLIPPNARPPSEELREQRGAEPAIPYIALVLTILIWSLAFLEGSVLFALSGYCPPTFAHSLLHAFLPAFLTSDPSTLTSLTVLTPTFLTGAFFGITGSLLRAHCFRTLGPRFTFQLSIRPSHTLVTNDVYGIVRHPSYTALLVSTVGSLLYASDQQGSVVAVCMRWAQAFSGNAGRGGDGDGSENAMVTGLLICMWTTVLAMLSLVVHTRMTNEDEVLEKYFGEEWRAWARRVPYRLVPGVY